MKSMIFSCKFLRVCALPVPAEGDSSAGRALSPASVRSEPRLRTEFLDVGHQSLGENINEIHETRAEKYEKLDVGSLTVAECNDAFTAGLDDDN